MEVPLRPLSRTVEAYGLSSRVPAVSVEGPKTESLITQETEPTTCWQIRILESSMRRPA